MAGWRSSGGMEEPGRGATRERKPTGKKEVLRRMTRWGKARGVGSLDMRTERLVMRGEA